MAQCEYWANVYVYGGKTYTVNAFGSREDANLNRSLRKRLAVVHVRLKPEGAPARYSSEHDRRNWEQYPEEMRKCPF